MLMKMLTLFMSSHIETSVRSIVTIMTLDHFFLSAAALQHTRVTMLPTGVGKWKMENGKGHGKDVENGKGLGKD